MKPTNILIKKQLLEKDNNGISIYDRYCKERFKAIRSGQLNLNITEQEITSLQNLEIEDIKNNNGDYKINKNTLYSMYKRTKKILSFDINYLQWYSCEQLRRCKQKQRKDIINHITFWILKGYEIHFSTYTLNDKTLLKYTDSNLENSKQLQDKLTRLIAQYTEDYIGNVDYGTINQRLHYHCLEAVKPKLIEYTDDNKIKTPINIEWEKYGFSTTELVNINDKSIFDVSSYIAKLTNHSIKIKANRLFIKKGTDWKNYKYLRSYYKDPINKYTMLSYIGKQLSAQSEQKPIFTEQQYKQIDLLYQIE